MALAVPPIPALPGIPPLPAFVVASSTLPPSFPLVAFDVFFGSAVFVPLLLPVVDIAEAHCTENVCTEFGADVPLHVPCQLFYPCVSRSARYYRPISRAKNHVFRPIYRALPASAPKRQPPDISPSKFLSFYAPVQFPCQYNDHAPPNVPDNFVPHQIPHPICSPLPIQSPCQLPHPFHPPPHTRPISHPAPPKRGHLNLKNKKA